jgi:hypothetical protein
MSHRKTDLGIPRRSKSAKVVLVDRYDPVAENLAKEIVYVGTSGVTDPREIAEIAVGHFRKTLS